MKKLTTLIAAAILAFGSVYAQTADEILKKFTDVIGGEENYKKVKTTYQEVKQVVNTPEGKKEINYKIWIEYPQKLRTEITIDTVHILRIVNETGGVAMSDTIRREIPEDQVEDAFNLFKMDITRSVNAYMFDKEDYDLKKDYKDYSIGGKERVKGNSCHKLKTETKEGGSTVVFFFDAKTGYLLKQVMTLQSERGEVDLEFLMSDYKPYEGFNVASTCEFIADGNSAMELTLQKLEINKPIDPKMFEIPAPVKK